MRFAPLLCLTLSICGCSEISPAPSPTVPSPPVSTPPPPPQPSNQVALWGYVVNPSGECIEGATAEVVAGPVLVGQKTTQETPCDFTRFSGGFMFVDAVPIAIEMTLRFSAPGYVSRLQTINTYAETVMYTLVPANPTHQPTGSGRN